MWLSKIHLNLHSRAVRTDLRDCHQLHRTLMRPFGETGDPSPRDALGVLYRVEQVRGSAVQLLLQSAFEPDYGKLPLDYCEGLPQLKEFGDTLDRLAFGQSFRFRLRANPTRSAIAAKGLDGLRGRGKRVEVRGEEECQSWIRKKAVQHGFQVSGCRVDSGPPDPRSVSGKITGTRNGAILTIATSLFDGLLQITDPILFAEALRGGIGRGKSYGQALLSISRQPSGTVISAVPQE